MPAETLSAEASFIAENTCSQKEKKKKKGLLVSIHEIRSRELVPQYDHQNFVCPSHPQVKGGLDFWFILLWQVQRGHVQSPFVY